MPCQLPTMALVISTSLLPADSGCWKWVSACAPDEGRVCPNKAFPIVATLKGASAHFSCCPWQSCWESSFQGACVLLQHSMEMLSEVALPSGTSKKKMGCGKNPVIL